MQKLNSQLLIGFMIISFGLACQTTPLEFTSTVVPSETAAPSETTTLAPLSPATPQPVPYPEIPDGFIPVDYYAGWYGVYFAYPGNWSILDYSFQMEADAAILLRDRKGGEIYLYPHSIAQFGTTDLAEILSSHLLQDSSVLTNHFLAVTRESVNDFKFTLLRRPEVGTVNSQNAASIILEVSFLADSEIVYYDTLVTEIVNGTEALLIIGYPSEDVETFTEIFLRLTSTVVLQPRLGPTYWQLGTSFTDNIAYHGITPNLYAIEATSGLTMLFVATSETGCKPEIIVFDAEDITSPVILKQGEADRLIRPLATASTRFNNTDVALIFTSDGTRDYIVGVDGCFDYTIYFWSLSSEEYNQVYETSAIPIGAQQDWEFFAEEGQGVPMIIIHNSSTNLRFEIRDTGGNLMNILPLQGGVGQPIGFVFTPEMEGTFILSASNQGELDGEYTVIIGDIDS